MAGAEQDRRTNRIAARAALAPEAPRVEPPAFSPPLAGHLPRLGDHPARSCSRVGITTRSRSPVLFGI
eukprot:15448402-Alexandrium_andersonii.AAC.1